MQRKPLRNEIFFFHICYFSRKEKENQRKKVQSDVSKLICRSHARNEVNVSKKGLKIHHKAVMPLGLQLTAIAVDKNDAR